jgi:hypothetical protein
LENMRAASAQATRAVLVLKEQSAGFHNHLEMSRECEAFRIEFNNKCRIIDERNAEIVANGLVIAEKDAIIAELSNVLSDLLIWKESVLNAANGPAVERRRW